ncbi:vitelline membrane outer layer protein 1 homolog isoform X1 [Ahaetulla prasina]|uniref:vitelline membrane outer layer protein 1 homolog isoform X1 n=1 Tax=Ahaetulla prasina TaxID=499056 RepID=UPI00264825F4|nr:vitelline membrane outer layer protein 1 homolog isoform X1 [Ahaetulla prasina]
MPLGTMVAVGLWFLVAALAGTGAAVESWPAIGVSNGGPWGPWAWQEMCPRGTYATGFSLKVEPYQGQAKDDTALNGLRLHCTRGGHDGKSEAKTVESQSNVWGRWTKPLWCPTGGYLTGFSLRVERVRRGISDYMGATNIRFVCSDGKVLEGEGLPWGEFGAWSPSCLKGLCGIQTKQEAIRGVLMDDSALNDIRFLCCTQ